MLSFLLSLPRSSKETGLKNDIIRDAPLHFFFFFFFEVALLQRFDDVKSIKCCDGASASNNGLQTLHVAILLYSVLSVQCFHSPKAAQC